MAWLPKRRQMPVVLPVLLIAVLAGVFAANRAAEDPWWTTRTDEGGEAQVKRSPTDDRSYRYIRLPNRMQVLLISDPATDKSAVALNVRVGSFQDPKDRQGLAHFLEHMLFLGTEKYPLAGEYQAFISEHGGSHNAYTSLENTTYYFDVDAKFLADTLDRFAQFFIAPRFDPTYVDRERQAVNSEYQLKLRDDGRREWDVLGEVVNPAHPLSQFSVGDLDTLADRPQDPVREDLVAFYRDHYSADRMALVVLGKEPLAQLEDAVRGRFAAVPTQAPEPEQPSIALFASPLPTEVLIRPDQERRELNLLFPVPSQKAHWRTRPADFLAYLIGDEGEGSLLANLKAGGLAEGLSAGLGFDVDGGAAFSISIPLTPAGMERKDEILAQTFAWLKKVRDESIVDWRYREFSRLEQISFRFMDKQPAATYVQALSAALHLYPPTEVIRGPAVLEVFDAALISSYADLLVPGNALVSLVDPAASDLDRTSRHYRAPYRVAAVPATLAQRWRDAGPVDGLKLSKKNPYIPDKFPVSGKNGAGAKPFLARRDQRVTLWHYVDDRFASPRAIFVARLGSSAVAGSPRAAAMTELYLALVRDQLNTEAYPALLAGLDFDLSSWGNGITVTLQGYVDKQPVLLNTVLNVLRDPDLDPVRFARVKAMMLREWRNSAREWPIKQIFEELGPLLGDSYRQMELAEALEPVAMDDLHDFVEAFYHTGHGLFYAGGAISSQTAYAMADSVATRLGLGIEGDSELVQRVLRLSPTALRPQHCLAVDAPDSGSVLYLQGANDSLDERAHIAMLASVLEAPFYNELRTQRQLGYVVGSNIMPIHRVPGMVLYAQSPRVSAATLMGEISGFLMDFKSTLFELDDAKFERHRQAVLSRIDEQPKNLAELAGRQQEALFLGFDDIDFREQLSKAVRAVTKESLAAAYRRVVVVGSRGLWATTLDQSNNEQCVDRETLVKRSNGYYLFPQ